MIDIFDVNFNVDLNRYGVCMWYGRMVHVRFTRQSYSPIDELKTERNETFIHFYSHNINTYIDNEYGNLNELKPNTKVELSTAMVMVMVCAC